MEHMDQTQHIDGAPDGLRAPEGTSRRAFLTRMAALGVIAVGAPQLIACGGGDGGDAPNGSTGTTGGAGDAASALNCDDPAALNDVDAGTRSALGYIEQSVTEGRDCTNCAQYVVAEEDGGCGTCKVVPGPINPAGWCSVWVELT